MARRSKVAQELKFCVMRNDPDLKRVYIASLPKVASELSTAQSMTRGSCGLWIYLLICICLRSVAWLLVANPWTEANKQQCISTFF